MSAVAELEQYLRHPPPTLDRMHHGNPIAVAHAALEALRDAGDQHYLFLRSILELANAATQQQQAAAALAPTEELLFHCLSGCRQVLLWQWTKGYSRPFLQAVREYLLLLGLGVIPLHHTSRTVRLACFSANVALWKRGWCDAPSQVDAASSALAPSAATTSPSPPEQAIMQAIHHQYNATVKNNHLHFPVLHGHHDLFAYLQGLLQNDQTIMASAATWFQALVTEFSGQSAVQYRMPLEFHKQAHRQFERHGALQASLHWTMTALERVLPTLSQLQGNHNSQIATTALEQANAVVQCTADIWSWEFGCWTSWDASKVGTASALSLARTLLRPPAEWRQYLGIQQQQQASNHNGGGGALLQALVQAHQHVRISAASSTCAAVAHNIRQLILLLASLSGPIFPGTQERGQHARLLLEWTLQSLQLQSQQQLLLRKDQEYSELMDTILLLTRLVSNFRLTVLSQFPQVLLPALQSMAAIGSRLLQDQAQACRAVHGDVDAMEHPLSEWREEAVKALLDCAVLVSSDPWVLYAGTQESRRQAQQELSRVLGPLYEAAVTCRTHMAAMEEHYLTSQDDEELDEVKEEIMAAEFEEELASLSEVGRLHLPSAISCLSGLFQTTIPRLQALWDTSGNANNQNCGDVTPDMAALLEEVRLLTLYVCQLLTDDNDGETPAIPRAVLQACDEQESLSTDIASAVQVLFQFAEAQARQIAANPSNVALSPVLARSFLWFLYRWAPAYVYPADFASSLESQTNPIIREWSTPAKAQQVVSYCVQFCVTYQCCWPHEGQVQEGATKLLMALARQGPQIRSLIVAVQPAFGQEMVVFHCLTASLRHGAPQHELQNILQSKLASKTTPDDFLCKLWGYQRLSYQDRARILSAILVACSDKKNTTAAALLKDSLQAVHDAFSSLVRALEGQHVGHDNVHAKEMTCLCLHLFCGIAEAAEMAQHHEHIPPFVTPVLPKLAALMPLYGSDLTVCELLLRFFRTYTEHFVAVLDREQSIVLFRASADLLQSYSRQQISNRRIMTKRSSAEVDAEEEQAYNDILCAIQLLIHLGTKDFIDSCSNASDDGGGVDSTQVTTVIFLGLQQILPLMTQGLLQYPTLCGQFFDLVGFMMETYAEKVCELPYDLFDSLQQALLFGMAHHNPDVARASLCGLASVAREHLQHHVLNAHLATHPDLLDTMIRRLLNEVVLSPVVLDRVETAGMALLPLCAANVQRLPTVLRDLCQQASNGDEQARHRLQQAFSKLLQPETLSKVAVKGHEGRLNRVHFKEAFQTFVNEVHSFLVMK